MGLQKQIFLAFLIVVLSFVMSSLGTNNLQLHNHDLPIMDYVQQEYGYDFQNYPSYFSPYHEAVEFDNSSLNFERASTKFDVGRVCSLVEAPDKTIDVVADFRARGGGRTDDTQRLPIFFKVYMSTLLLGHDQGGEDLYVSIPLGGPIYVPDSIGPLTRVSDFETSVYQELQSLKEDLSGDSTETCDAEIMVDELKIFREDELVNKAFEEAFKDGELTMDASLLTGEQVSPKSDDNSASGLDFDSLQNSEGDKTALVSSELSNPLPLRTCDNKKSNKNPSGKRTKRKRSNGRNNNFDESYLAKVEVLARVKQKQKEDRAAVRLHSFNGSGEPRHGAKAKAEKIKSLKSGSVSTKVRASSTCGNVPVNFPETVLSVEVYHNRKTWLKTQEFLVLGRQFLSEVRDRICCLTDEIMKKAGRCDPSGYFLIEDVFYNDTRESSAIDYSKPILDWLENSKNDALEKWEYILSGELQKKQKELLGSESKQKLPTLKSGHMQRTRFCDLKFRLGAGYLYCHQGDCKHIIIIRDMRLIHPEDVQSRTAYPLITLQLKLRYKKCSVCKIYRAAKMTVDDKWASSNPCYFCDVCYYMLHYANGSLLYSDFNVFDYHHE